MEENVNPNDGSPTSGPSMLLVSSDPAEIVRELAELEHRIQDADADVAVKDAALKSAKKDRDALVAELRAKVREIDAPPMPLFSGPEASDAGIHGAAD